MYLIFDTETTGLPRNYNAPVTDLDNWPRAVQIAWQLHDDKGQLIEAKNLLIKPEGFTIPFNAVQVHGITTEKATKEGLPLTEVLDAFSRALERSKYIAGHNIIFDINIMGAEFLRAGKHSNIASIASIDTKDESTDYCALPGGKGGKFKWPTLEELHQKLFGKGFSEAHNAAADVEATTRCFFELCRIGIVKRPDIAIDEKVMLHLAEIAPSILITVQQKEKASTETTIQDNIATEAKTADPVSISFTHLHCHSQFSSLPGTSEIEDLVAKAKKLGMPAVAITDHGNMYGAFTFVDEALKQGIKPIVGCEFYLCQDHKNKSQKDNGFNQVLLAKNKIGYHHLAKLSSQAFIDGYYYVPRIDRQLLLQYKEHLIATTGSLSGEVPNLILNVGETQAEQAFLWWKEQFGDDFYIQLQRHGLPEEDHVNEVLLGFAKKHQVKYFAANNTYYNDKEGAEAHDILLCIRDGELKETPIGKGRGFRFGFPNDQFYFKTTEEMLQLFADLPEALATTQEIADKVESYKLKRDVLLPKFDIPAEFQNEDDYLRYLTYEGAKKRYGTIEPAVKDRIDFELETIKKTGYPGYFLIVQDFTNEARKQGVSVGPGRGSAAGSVVAYCTGITNVDPIKYDLLFERFLNPDRVSMPDIDIDFDDRGREKVMRYVIEKYGKTQVAQIVTYGTMAAKSAIRDTARVLNLPLPDADRLAKSFPANPKASLKKLLKKEDIDEKLKDALKGDELTQAYEFRKLSQSTDLTGQTLRQAVILEGSLRTTGTHACGVIITPEDITNIVPVKSVEDAEISLVTQFDNSVAENAGLLKMDFLGLNTLTIINDAIDIIEERHGIRIDPDTIPLDDPKTYELFQRGETIGIFQYESPGMQKHMKELKPDKFDDLIAMNALYRPGPIAYIPNYIARKHGREPITYDLPAMEENLKETYGITVYQEQVMLLSQKLAGFTKGKADELRKAMGKKIRSKLDELKPLFLEGCKTNGHDTERADKVWKDWEAFAEYAFNKSHSTCYAVVAFHTAYLKANYPAEFMASVLTQNMNDLKQVTFFLDECKRMGLQVLGPDVNESNVNFSVNKQGQIRFGLGAIKGTGGAATTSIIEDRKANGVFKDIYDFVSRISLRVVNKKSLEALANGGGFDCFGLHRAQYFYTNEKDNVPFIEKLIRYGNSVQGSQNSMGSSLFGESDESISISTPAPPDCKQWDELWKLKIEKEVIGVYLSGHPLDQYRLELQHFCTVNTHTVLEERNRGKEVSIGGVMSSVEIRKSQKGDNFAICVFEDYEGTMELRFFGKDYIQFASYLTPATFIYINGKIQQRWGQQDQWEFKPTAICLLSEVRDKKINSITLSVPLKAISENFIQQVQDVITQNSGNCRLKFIVGDPEDQINVDMPSKKFKVNPSNEFLKVLDEMKEVRYKLN